MFKDILNKRKETFLKNEKEEHVPKRLRESFIFNSYVPDFFELKKIEKLYEINREILKNELKPIRLDEKEFIPLVHMHPAQFSKFHLFYKAPTHSRYYDLLKCFRDIKSYTKPWSINSYFYYNQILFVTKDLYNSYYDDLELFHDTLFHQQQYCQIEIKYNGIRTKTFDVPLFKNINISYFFALDELFFSVEDNFDLEIESLKLKSPLINQELYNLF